MKAISQIDKGWQIELEDNHVLHGQNLILAIGNSEKLHWPEWAMALKDHSQAQVHHIFETHLPKLEAMKPPFTVIGGGITAV
ncbi:MAG: hypothetical protein WBF39_14665, partial [Planococcus donghaensis]